MSLADIQSMKALKLLKKIPDFSNLFDPNKRTSGQFLNADGSFITNANYYTSDFIPVLPSYRYFCFSVRVMVAYDINKNLISAPCNFTTVKSNIIVTIPANVAYIRFSSQIALLGSTSRFSVITAPPNVWNGKVANALGDSVTSQGQWQPFINDALGITLNNYGVAGTLIADKTGTDTTAMCRDERINQLLSTADLVLAMGGMNDWAQNVALGTITDTVTSSFYGAVNTMAKKLITRFPTKRIVLMTPNFGKMANRAGWSDTYGLVNNVGLTTGDYGKAIIDVGRLYGIPVVDVYGNCGWSDINLSTYVGDDGGGVQIHPNATGGQRIAEVAIGVLERIKPIS